MRPVREHAASDCEDALRRETGRIEWNGPASPEGSGNNVVTIYLVIHFFVDFVVYFNINLF